jgi:putative DNA primase/helicase
MRMHQLVRDCFSTWVATEKVTKDDVKLMASILNTAKKRSVLDALASYPGIAMTGDEWDRNWWQLGVRNGVVDLRDLTFTPKGDPDDLITKSAGADWDSTLTDADAPVFMANLAEITARADGTPDPDAMEHLLLVLGYALFGALFEEIFEEWVGHGRNGKGKLKDIVLHVFGDYGMTLPAGFYMVSRDGPPDSARPRPELLKIMGIRIGFDSEPEGGRLNDQRLKKHSGGDEDTARNLHDKHYVTFLPTHLTVILTNNVLKLENVDPAIESRLIVRPFDRRFDVDTDPPADTARLARMKRESSAILGILARRAARYWQLAKPQAGEDGTRIVIKANMPDRIRLAGQLNLAESDRFRAALAEAFIRDPEAFSSQDELHRKYTEWFKDPETDDPGTWLSKPDLMKKLRGAGFEEGRRKSGTVRGFVGIRPNNAMDLPPEPPADPSDDDEIADQSDQSDQSEGGR